ncbi:glutaredoxin domain-containing cysteine-rich protein CG31559-like [Octopus vulgaris]|uniref:Glutaredoxin domain-containing cysteine-rich protein CG31559-like n=2 Tax=Octopus TaxID=6643 RepID=A0AA36BIQ3_OCTVU|nr:glutaredoxin domain-containing cysteine-rich protein CG31559-like [Octopus sinensis]XP_036367499.1 glutaredoxin domain-containing cysteine-rich protein CG31559-like [Octopus sinensis]XP_036367500.1 glutaredoxin domain-containing cysteine-rich protein CG31559-like [Octopus sinensis]CAI9734427.1 glutaredoxin domain-containing cysteine-rich protein CG31559-like [Octopus vulgaris]
MDNSRNLNMYSTKHVNNKNTDQETKSKDKSIAEKNYSKLNSNNLYKQKNLIPQKPANTWFNMNAVKTLPLTESNFVGRRDVSDPNTLQEIRITSAKGTVRGYKNRVRAGIVTFLKEQSDGEWNYLKCEKGKIIVYMTSMRVVRQTYDRCQIVQKILQTHLVKYEERDLFMSRENQRELRERLGKSDVTIPQVFADGLNLGTAETLEVLNESGELREILKSFEKITVQTECSKCGGYNYVPCSVCHGSKRSIHRNNFTEEFAELRCVYCDENGLLKCDHCLNNE